jgi:hypothetical protein
MTIRIFKSIEYMDRDGEQPSFHLYQAKKVRYNPESTVIQAFDREPIPLVALSKDDLLQLVNDIKYALENEPIVNEKLLCDTLDVDYQSPSDIESIRVLNEVTSVIVKEVPQITHTKLDAKDDDNITIQEEICRQMVKDISDTLDIARLMRNEDHSMDYIYYELIDDLNQLINELADELEGGANE